MYSLSFLNESIGREALRRAPSLLLQQQTTARKQQPNNCARPFSDLCALHHLYLSASHAISLWNALRVPNIRKICKRCEVKTQRKARVWRRKLFDLGQHPFLQPQRCKLQNSLEYNTLMLHLRAAPTRITVPFKIDAKCLV